MCTYKRVSDPCFGGFHWLNDQSIALPSFKYEMDSKFASFSFAYSRALSRRYVDISSGRLCISVEYTIYVRSKIVKFSSVRVDSMRCVVLLQGCLFISSTDFMCTFCFDFRRSDYSPILFTRQSWSSIPW